MSEAEFSTLVADIKENGLREPIIVHEGKVLDGRNRYRACLEIGIEPMTRPWDGKGNPLDFVVSKNLHRRHLDESQRGMVSAKIANMRQGARTDLRPIGPKSEVPEVSISEAAKLMNVSERSVTRAKAVLANGTPELKQAMEAGAVSLKAAAEVASMPEEEQRMIVSQGPKAIREAGKCPESQSLIRSSSRSASTWRSPARKRLSEALETRHRPPTMIPMR